VMVAPCCSNLSFAADQMRFMASPRVSASDVERPDVNSRARPSEHASATCGGAWRRTLRFFFLIFRLGAIAATRFCVCFYIFFT